MAQMRALHVKTAAQNLTLHVQIKGVNQWRWRLALGAWLIRLAAWVMWLDVEFEAWR